MVKSKLSYCLNIVLLFVLHICRRLEKITIFVHTAATPKVLCTELTQFSIESKRRWDGKGFALPQC